jgi:hypothetical protein
MIFYFTKNVIASLPTATDPDKEQHEQARVRAAANLRRIDRLRNDSESEDDESERGRDRSRRPRKEDLQLDQYENQIAMELVAPEDIPVGFEGSVTCWNPASIDDLTMCRYRWIG